MQQQEIPEVGSVVDEIVELEKIIGDPEIEAYEEVSACSLTCKVCKACTCEEDSSIK